MVLAGTTACIIAEVDRVRYVKEDLTFVAEESQSLRFPLASLALVIGFFLFLSFVFYYRQNHTLIVKYARVMGLPSSCTEPFKAGQLRFSSRKAQGGSGSVIDRGGFGA